ncbi:MAG TPA: glycoside hydrolase family 3 N-terminal domain-containing protein, partial [Ilumatobacteraceae bacterium]
MADADEEFVDTLTLDEQVALLAGADFWHTVPVERLGIPTMRVTDGPVGARGTRFGGGPASIAVPCGTSLAATWDPQLVQHVGEVLGRETRARGARVLLAPTVNLHRTPIGGRNFECMSEDPYLTARVAVAYVRGVQSEGVACCVKHFIGNDTEFERNTIDSRIDERTLRELYLVPFEAAVKEAEAMSVMTSYNRINGPWAADSAELVDGVLRGEWGFDGIVISDWFGLHSTVEAIRAGLDLEMPGPTLHRGDHLVAAVADGHVDRS